jgi:cob(I)alamin adenosyltransferase
MFRLIGSVDELSSYLGIFCRYISPDSIPKLYAIQNLLSELLGSAAGDVKPSAHL